MCVICDELVSYIKKNVKRILQGFVREIFIKTIRRLKDVYDFLTP